MIGIIVLFTTIMMIIAAIMTIFQKDLLSSVVSMSMVGLIAVVLFFIMNAPDVALTEAAIGAGLTTIILVIAIRKTKRYESHDE